MRFARIAVSLLALAAANVSAQSYPTKPIRLILGSQPGGNLDIVA